VNLRAGVSFGNTKVQLYARNVFDERGQLAARVWGAGNTSSLTAPFYITILEPRTIGFTVSTTF
jgi:iron complex outermembrane recepter protein